MRAIFFALLAHILGEGARYRQTCIALWKVLGVPQGVGPLIKLHLRLGAGCVLLIFEADSSLLAT